MFEYILKNQFDENEKLCILNLVDKVQFNVKLNHEEDENVEYVIKIIQA